MRRAYADTQSNVRQYFLQLKEAYTKRDQLWNDLQDAVEMSGESIFCTHGENLQPGPNGPYHRIVLTDMYNLSATKTMASLSSLPAELEETVATIEKKSKEVSKTTAVDGKARQKLLRELLAAEV